jgi:hypothetical protein
MDTVIARTDINSLWVTCLRITSCYADAKQGLIRAAEDDDDFTLATTTRTRKKKDTDDQVKIAKREYQLPVSPHHNVCTYKIN